MALFRIQGGTPLSGTITVQGSKNAALPIIAATLLTDEECVLHRVPKLTDVFHILDLLKSIGVDVEWIGPHDVRICAKNASPKTLDQKSVAALRGSMFLLGPLIARFGAIDIFEPGGDIIGKRPLDRHIRAFCQLGARVDKTNGTYRIIAENGLSGARVIIPEFSVGATENALMAAVTATGVTRIATAATEPHVQDLCTFLLSMGAKIDGVGTHDITVTGVERLKGSTHTIIPDRDVVGTFAVAAAATRGNVFIDGANPRHIEIVLDRLETIGAIVTIEDGGIRVAAGDTLRAFNYQALPYPGLPTDLQAPFGVLATQCVGTSLIHDTVYNGRLGYINELLKMGANAVICDPHRALITGPTPLSGTEVRSLDIRAGATLIIAALVATGETLIHDAHILDRGYEHIDVTLKHLGADITRLE